MRKKGRQENRHKDD